MIDADLLRRHFPGRPDRYFDHAAVATTPASVADAVADVAHALSQGLRGSSDWHGRTDNALELLSADLGVDAAQLSVLANTSTAFNTVVRSVPLTPGSRVLTFSDDFPSPRMPWPAISNAHVTEIDPGDDRTASLLTAITSDTAAVSITHVHATTGEAVDLARVYEACRRADALLLVDGAQAAGLFPRAAVHADVYVGASYKWLLAGFGAAVVATSKRFDDIAVPVFRGYMNPEPSSRLEVGHANLFMLAALGEAAAVRQAFGLDSIRQHTVHAAQQIATHAAASGYQPLVAAPEAGIVSLRVRDAQGLQQSLSEDGFTVAVRQGCVRISPYITTTQADIDSLLEALENRATDYTIEEGAR